MRNRCNNSRTPDYKFYGGRGIKICAEWDDFLVFEQDMLSGFKEGLTIDRINVNGPYSKENCRWATRIEQCNNRRSNVLLTLNRRTQNINQWAQELKIDRDVLYKRKSRAHWTDEKILTTPLMKNYGK